MPFHYIDFTTVHHKANHQLLQINLKNMIQIFNAATYFHVSPLRYEIACGHQGLIQFSTILTIRKVVASLSVKGCSLLVGVSGYASYTQRSYSLAMCIVLQYMYIDFSRITNTLHLHPPHVLLLRGGRTVDTSTRHKVTCESDRLGGFIL